MSTEFTCALKHHRAPALPHWICTEDIPCLDCRHRAGGQPTRTLAECQRLPPHHLPPTARDGATPAPPGAAQAGRCRGGSHQGFHSAGRGATMPSRASHISSGSASGSIPITRPNSLISAEEGGGRGRGRADAGPAPPPGLLTDAPPTLLAGDVGLVVVLLQDQLVPDAQGGSGRRHRPSPEPARPPARLPGEGRGERRGGLVRPSAAFRHTQPRGRRAGAATSPSALSACGGRQARTAAR